MLDKLRHPIGLLKGILLLRLLPPFGLAPVHSIQHFVAQYGRVLVHFFVPEQLLSVLFCFKDLEGPGFDFLFKLRYLFAEFGDFSLSFAVLEKVLVHLRDFFCLLVD